MHLDHDRREALAEGNDGGAVPDSAAGGSEAQRHQLLPDGDAGHVEGRVISPVCEEAARRRGEVIDREFGGAQGGSRAVGMV